MDKNDILKALFFLHMIGKYWIISLPQQYVVITLLEIYTCFLKITNA